MNPAILTNHSEPDSIGRHSALVLFLFAFAFRLIYIIQSVDNPLFGVPIVDAHVYDAWAERMSQGVWLWDHVGNYLPIYPGFLALQKIIFGNGPLVNKLIQSFMGSLAAVMMAQTAARAWNRPIGLLTGYLLAANWMLVIFDAEMFAESFSIFFMSLTLWLLIQFSDRSRAVLAAGFAFALSAGVRANLFLILPFVLGWLIWKNRSRRVSAAISAVLFTLGTVAIIGPIMVRNYHLTGIPILRAQGTWSLYSGISPEFEGLHPPTGILFNKYMNLPLQAGLRTEAEIERFWGRKVLSIIREDPSGVVLNFLKHLAIFCNAREWSQEFDVYIYRGYSGFLSLPWPGFWLIGPLGFLGLFLVNPLSENRRLILGCTVIGILSIILFKASDRYRLPSAVMLTIFAALALWHLYIWAQKREKRKLLTSVAVLSILCLIGWPDWPRLEDRKTARHDFYIGIQHESHGRIEEAIRSYEISMNDFPWDPDSPYRIGRILYRAGQVDRAKYYLQEALNREPAFPKALNETARISLAAGLVSDAEKQALDSLRLNPIEKDTLLLLADIRRQQGDVAGEIFYLKRAAQVNAEAVLASANRLVDIGDVEDAIRLFDLVMRSHDVDRYVRVQAAMTAGITSARHFRDEKRARIYWQTVEEEFSDFTFFAVQASYLSGAIDDHIFQKQMKQSDKWAVSWSYATGLKRWMAGDDEAAAISFRRCLAGIADMESKPDEIPQNWAWEDLQRICRSKTIICGDMEGDVSGVK